MGQSVYRVVSATLQNLGFPGGKPRAKGPVTGDRKTTQAAEE